MKKLLFYSLLLSGFAAATVLSSCSCKRTFNDQEFQGPGIIGAPAGFTGVVDAFTACDNNKATCKPLDDTTNTAKQLVFGVAYVSSFNTFVAFHATLSHKVTWTLTIKGNRSGAIKTFTGTSQIIDETNAYWKGRADGNEFFKTGESLTATLSFLNSEITSTLYLKILNNPNGPYDYQKNPIAPITLRKLQDDYDMNFVSGGPVGMRTTYADLADGVTKASFVIKNDNKVQEDFSLYMHGTDYNGNGYLGGFSTENLTELKNNFNTHSADSFYYNAYVYGYGRPNTCLMFLLYEDDDASGIYDATHDDNWQYIQQIDWVGWKLVSIKHSDFKAASNPQSGGSGNRIREPYKVVGAAMELQSYPTPGKEVEANVDYVYFSQGGPFVK